MGSVKPILSLAELARLLRVSRRTTMRLLEKHGIPFEQERRGTFPQHGTGIRIMASDLRRYAPKLFGGLRELGELSAVMFVEPERASA